MRPRRRPTSFPCRKEVGKKRHPIVLPAARVPCARQTFGGRTKTRCAQTFVLLDRQISTALRRRRRGGNTNPEVPESIGRGAPVCAPALPRRDRRGCRPQASIPGYMPASRRDATAEPGGFTAISRWSSAAIPPGYHRSTGPPPGRHRTDHRANTTGHRDFNGDRTMLY